MNIVEPQDIAPVAGSPYDVITGETSQAKKIASLRSVLVRVPLFRDMNQEDQDLFAGLVKSAHADPGEVLVRQGDPGSELFIITEGTARVEVDGREIARLGAGEFFGEISLLDGKPRTSTVIAASAMSLMTIQKPAFDHLCATVPGISTTMIAILCARLRGRGVNPLD
jgi:CRP-like cAMP-binding protein